ncbi:unnamed protein product, partial [Laminaria digitata]
ISGDQSARKPISGEQSGRNRTGDRCGQSGSQGSRSSAKKVKDRRSRSLSRRGGDRLDASDLPRGGGIAGSENTDEGNNDNNINNNNSNTEDDPLEGVMHDGAMFLVDPRRRVFSAQRDERGDLVKV